MTRASSDRLYWGIVSALLVAILITAFAWFMQERSESANTVSGTTATATEVPSADEVMDNDTTTVDESAADELGANASDDASDSDGRSPFVQSDAMDSSDGTGGRYSSAPGDGDADDPKATPTATAGNSFNFSEGESGVSLGSVSGQTATATPRPTATAAPPRPTATAAPPRPTATPAPPRPTSTPAAARSTSVPPPRIDDLGNDVEPQDILDSLQESDGGYIVTYAIGGDLPLTTASRVLDPGPGPGIARGDLVAADWYVVSLLTGATVENTWENDQPTEFVVGGSAVPTAMSDAIMGQAAGAIVALIYPRDMADMPDKFDEKDAFLVIITVDVLDGEF